MYRGKMYEIVHCGGKSFTFTMTDHLDHQCSRDYALQEIAKWISGEEDDKRWHKDVPWMREHEEVDWLSILTTWRIAHIVECHPLFRLLDDHSRRAFNRNYLIFAGHISHVLEIRVTHFGPFGNMAKLHRFESRLDNVSQAFKRLLDSLGIGSQSDWDRMSNAEKQDKQRILKQHVNECYEKLLSTRKSAMQSAKDDLKEWIKKVLGAISDEAKKIIISIDKAVTKDALREVHLLIEKELCQQIGQVTAKQESKQILGSATGELPSTGFVAGRICALKGLSSGDGASASTELESGNTMGDLKVSKDHQTEIEKTSVTLNELAKEIEKLEACFAVVKEFMDHPQEKDFSEEDGIIFLEAVEYVHKNYSCWD